MKTVLYTLIFIFSFSVLSAQEKLSKEEKARREKNIQAGNPFVKYGCKAPVATLSKGKYLEVQDLDSIVTIGTSRWHVDNKKIVGDIVRDTLNPDAQPVGDAPGMWMSPDPLSEEFPSYSPYNFCMGNPMRYKDPDGRAPTDWFKSETGRVVWFDNKSKGFTDTNGGKWSNVGANLNEVKQNLNVPTATQNIEWNSKSLMLNSGSDGAGKTWVVGNPVVFDMSAQVNYNLNIENTKSPLGGLISGKSEITGVNINARVSSETGAPGIQIQGVIGNFGISEMTPSSLIFSGHSFAGVSSPFMTLNSPMLSNAPSHSTSEATLKLNLPAFNTLNKSFGSSTGFNLQFNTSTTVHDQATDDQSIIKTRN